VRGALEDALHGPEPDFNFDDWAKTGDEVKMPAATGAGASMGGGVSAFEGISYAHTVYVPGDGGTSGIALHNGHGILIGTIQPPSWAGAVRAVILVIVTIFFGLAMINVVRGGFAGR
jgi:hypothetical protein